MVKFNTIIPPGDFSFFFSSFFFILFFSTINSPPLLLTFVLDGDGLYIGAVAQSTHTGVTHAFNIILKWGGTSEHIHLWRNSFIHLTYKRKEWCIYMYIYIYIYKKVENEGERNNYYLMILSIDCKDLLICLEYS